MIRDLEYRLPGPVYDAIRQHLDTISSKRRRNSIRDDYYDMENLFRDLGIAIPPNLRNLEVAMGWPAKAVDHLNRRTRCAGFVLPGGDLDQFGIRQAWADNRMDVEAPQIQTSSLIHAVAFILTYLGDVASGEPEVVHATFNARNGTGRWDPIRRSLIDFLGIVDRDEFGEPTRLLYVTRTAALQARWDAAARSWDVRMVSHSLGRCPVEPLVYRPRLGRPFGSSRISRAVMSLTDSAMRTVVRSEVGAEFFSAPQRYLLGADEEDFVGPSGERKSTWDMVIGRILAIERDEDGEVPTVGQFPQVSMQPHAEHLRMWATLFAGETGLALSSLGVTTDNPASAEAIYAAKEDLVIEAEGCADGWTPAYVRSAVTGVQMRFGLTQPPAELRSLGMRWHDPSTPSRAARTDAVMKQVAAGILPADSPVTLEELGFDDITIERVTTDRRRAQGAQLAQVLAQAATGDVAG